MKIFLDARLALDEAFTTATAPAVPGEDSGLPAEVAGFLAHLRLLETVPRDLPSALRDLDGADRNFAGAAIFLGVVGDLLALDEAPQAGALKRGGMHETVLDAVIGLDEAEALLVIVPLHGALIHGHLPFTDSAR